MLRRRYGEITGQMVEECGFKVLKDDGVHGWLGASPDGLLHPSGLLPLLVSRLPALVISCLHSLLLIFSPCLPFAKPLLCTLSPRPPRPARGLLPQLAPGPLPCPLSTICISILVEQQMLSSVADMLPEAASAAVEHLPSFSTARHKTSLRLT